jgi:CO dehydrogenase/acetyl-CoA synthase epsilon subunit
MIAAKLAALGLLLCLCDATSQLSFKFDRVAHAVDAIPEAPEEPFEHASDELVLVSGPQVVEEIKKRQELLKALRHQLKVVSTQGSLGDALERFIEHQSALYESYTALVSA